MGKYNTFLKKLFQLKMDFGTKSMFVVSFVKHEHQLVTHTHTHTHTHTLSLSLSLISQPLPLCTVANWIVLCLNQCIIFHHHQHLGQVQQKVHDKKGHMFVKAAQLREIMPLQFYNYNFIIIDATINTAHIVNIVMHETTKFTSHTCCVSHHHGFLCEKNTTFS
jgi:hypothetical protein